MNKITIEVDTRGATRSLTELRNEIEKSKTSVHELETLLGGLRPSKWQRRLSIAQVVCVSIALALLLIDVLVR